MSRICSGPAATTESMRCDLHVHTTALGDVHGAPAWRRVPRKLQPSGRRLRKAETARHGPGDHHRSRLHRRGGSTAAARGLLPQRGSHLPPAQRHGIARGGLRHHGTGPRGAAAAARRFRIAGGVARRAAAVLSAPTTYSRASPGGAGWRISTAWRGISRRWRRTTRHAAGAPTGARRRLADRMDKAEVGGSDAHAMASVGCAWTPVRRRADEAANIWRDCAAAWAASRGECGSVWKLTRDVLAIGAGHAAGTTRQPRRWRRWPWRFLW